MGAVWDTCESIKITLGSHSGKVGLSNFSPSQSCSTSSPQATCSPQGVKLHPLGSHLAAFPHSTLPAVAAPILSSGFHCPCSCRMHWWGSVQVRYGAAVAGGEWGTQCSSGEEGPMQGGAMDGDAMQCNRDGGVHAVCSQRGSLLTLVQLVGMWSLPVWSAGYLAPSHLEFGQPCFGSM